MLPVLQAFGHGGGGQWSAVQIPLHLVAVVVAQEAQLPLGLHALGDDFEVQCMGQPDDGGDDLVVIVIGYIFDGSRSHTPLDRCHPARS
jgi:hypothetical protein